MTPILLRPELSPPGQALRLLPWLMITVLLALAARFALSWPELHDVPLLTDFDAFYIAGQMVRDGRAGEAYHVPTMLDALEAAGGKRLFMPWTYPPSFDLLVGLLPVLPRGLSYFLFMLLTFGAYVLALRRLAPDRFGLVLTATLPALVVTMICGQNGFLTGAFAGFLALGLLRDRMAAGIPFGLMLIKPHLGVGLGLGLVLARCRGTVLLAGATWAVGALAASAAFGWEIWPAFLDGVRAAMAHLETDGTYPLHRMVSIHAFLRRAGLPQEGAMALQIGVALLACGAVVLVALRTGQRRIVLGVACLATLMVSPYVYDYDLPILGIGLALLAPEIFGPARPGVTAAILLLSWLAGGIGWSLGIRVAQVAEGAASRFQVIPSLGGPALLGLFGLVLWLLWRGPAAWKASGA